VLIANEMPGEILPIHLAGGEQAICSRAEVWGATAEGRPFGGLGLGAWGMTRRDLTTGE
jgi:hypothetical protein